MILGEGPLESLTAINEFVKYSAELYTPKLKIEFPTRWYHRNWPSVGSIFYRGVHHYVTPCIITKEFEILI